MTELLGALARRVGDGLTRDAELRRGSERPAGSSTLDGGMQLPRPPDPARGARSPRGGGRAVRRGRAARCGAPPTPSGSRSSRCSRAATSSSRACPAPARRCSPSRWPPRSAAASAGCSAPPTCCPPTSPAPRCTARPPAIWDFRPGPIFANVVLVDEVNRASPRTQAALLEPMEERQVTVDGVTHQLPDPFFLVATQNPFGSAGTFPLPESQLDRFALVCTIGLPGPRRRARDPRRRGWSRRARRARAGDASRPSSRRRSPRCAACTARTPFATTCSTSPTRRATIPASCSARRRARASACCAPRRRTRR